MKFFIFATKQEEKVERAKLSCWVEHCAIRKKTFSPGLTVVWYRDLKPGFAVFVSLFCLIVVCVVCFNLIIESRK